MSLERVRERLTLVMGLDPSSLSRVGLETTVRGRMRALGFDELEQYADRLDVDMGEFERLAMAVMVHETSFFRYPASFELLAREARAHLARGGAEPFRVHCLASSTGEEPASIVMALLDAGVDMARVEVQASDVSERAIEYARRGRYRRRNVNRLPEQVRERWFEPAGDAYELRAEVRRHVAHGRLNALDPAFGLGAARYHALFCRNLMIYLVPEARRALLRRLRSLLHPGALLFVGHAEVAAARAAGLELAAPPEAFACRLVPQPQRPAAGRAQPPRGEPAERAPPRSPPRPRRGPARPPRAVPGAPATDRRDPDEVLRRAARLADAGDLQQARRALLDGIAEGPVTADHYHLLALVESARGRDDESEAALRRALYLDAGHYPSLMQLALLAETRGDRGRAERLRAKAARVREGGHER